MVKNKLREAQTKTMNAGKLAQKEDTKLNDLYKLRRLHFQNCFGGVCKTNVQSMKQAADAFPHYAAGEEAAAPSSAPPNPYEEPKRMLEAHETELQLPVFTIQEAEMECTSKPTRNEEQEANR
ncbi:hypothetical protein ATANTOWER_029748 [Ataeniobius toweri]|uniref:Uncharacterized protein n=1 Tax=Ataeniobius toweri TaxID=208326 RepID=A0ABU7ATZ8_9TELE|nr:hypothetical protein [Ataeniobius toweri]